MQGCFRLAIFIEMVVNLPHIEEVKALCSNHRVRHQYIFGSFLTERFDSESDVDLLVEFEAMDPSDYTDKYFDLKFSLQNLFNRPVDLIEEKAIKNPFFKKSIDSRKRLVYGR